MPLDNPGSMTDVLRTVTDGLAGNGLLGAVLIYIARMLYPIAKDAATALVTLATKVEMHDLRLNDLERRAAEEGLKRAELERRLAEVEAQRAARNGTLSRLPTVHATPIGVEG